MAVKKIQIPSEENIRAVYRQGAEAVVKAFQELSEMVVTLTTRVTELEDQLSKNSSNSGKPPSSDGYEKPAPKSRRKRSGKKSGGQAGHSGHTLEMVAKPDKVEAYPVNCCTHCHTSLKKEKAIRIERRQVFDLPEIHLEVKEHQAEVKRCPKCGQTTTASFPSEVSQPTQYGKKIKSQMAYFHEYQLLPLKRTQETLKDLYDQSVGAGTIVSACKELATKVKPANQAIKKHLTYHELVVCFDETGLRIKGALHWLHVTCTRLLTYYEVHNIVPMPFREKRGKKAMDAIGILPNFTGRAIHDGLPAYFQYPQLQHGLCNEHHSRELDFLEERHPQKWVTELSNLMLEIKAAVDTAKEKSKTKLSPKTLADFSTQYAPLLTQGFKKNPPPKTEVPAKPGRPKQSIAKNLLDRLLDHKEAVLAFMYDFKVPFDNNQAERDTRSGRMKVKQKISGCFRSDHGSETFCAIRGYISTARKNDQPVLDVLHAAFEGHPYIPAFVSLHG
jgi:transposase